METLEGGELLFHLNDSCDIISNIDKEFVEKGNVFEEEIVSMQRNTSSTSNDADRDIPVTSQVDFAIENHQERKMTRSRSVDRNKEHNNTSGLKDIEKNRFRPCPYCGVQQTKLTRHITLIHKFEPEVMDIMSHPKGKKSSYVRFTEKKRNS
ncbi:hypothetical protein Avbf_09218 [Armadillidium vulgare]|nr:hypothetical protein Avbf_09218 [Armadillidium vulgare]